MATHSSLALSSDSRRNISNLDYPHKRESFHATVWLARWILKIRTEPGFGYFSRLIQKRESVPSDSLWNVSLFVVFGSDFSDSTQNLKCFLVPNENLNTGGLR